MEEDEITLYGGGFDPLHAGHKQILDWLVRYCRRPLWVCPTAQPEHKPDGPASTWDVRVTDLHHYLQRYPDALRPLIRDEEHKHPSIAGRTIRLLNTFRTTCPRTRFSIAVGADSWYNLASWERIDSWFSTVDWIVFRRGPGNKLPNPESTGIQTGNYVRTEHTLYRRYQNNTHTIFAMYNQPLEHASRKIRAVTTL